MSQAVLASLLQPAAALINRQIAATTPARALCRELEGRVMAVRVSNTSLAMYLAVSGDRVTLSGHCDREPDVVLGGSLLSLAVMAGPRGEELIRAGEISISGDALLAQQFQKLLRYGRPDLEEELSRLIGDVAAHSVGELLRSVAQWGQEARTTMRQNIGDYLQEESRSVPSRHEAERFRGDINTLRDDVARFEARLRKLEEDALT